MVFAVCLATLVYGVFAQPPPPPLAPCKFSSQMFHEAGQEVHFPKVFTLDSSDDMHFKIHSLNNSFDDTVGTISKQTGGRQWKVEAYFSDIKANRTGSIFNGCGLIFWQGQASRQVSQEEWQKGALPPLPPPCEFH